MLATGGSALMAINVLKEAGVAEDNIMFINVVSCPEGLKNLAENAPGVRIITAACDQVCVCNSLSTLHKRLLRLLRLPCRGRLCAAVTDGCMTPGTMTCRGWTSSTLSSQDWETTATG